MTKLKMGSFPHDRDQQYMPGAGPAAEPPGDQGGQLQGQPMPRACFPPLDRTEKSDWHMTALASALYLCVIH